MKKVLFLGSKPIGYECLSFLIQQMAVGQYEIVGVLAKENVHFDTKFNIHELAEKNHLHRLESLSDMLQLEQVDVLISVQYHEILKKEHISKAKLAVNLHMAPLPDYRGCNQFTFAILDEKNEFGTTLHRLEEGIDSGDIIAEDRFEIRKGIFVSELYELTYSKSIELFRDNILDIIEGRCTLKPQSSYKDRSTSLHFRNEIQRVKEIDLSWPKEKIERHIRATYMPGFEPPFTMVNDKKFYFTEA